MSDVTIETGVIVSRTFAAELTVSDGRTIDVQVVPYGERIRHNDGLGGVPRGEWYEEEWAHGAFREQAAAHGRERHVLVNMEHEQGIRGVVGHGLALREDADALYGSFRLHDGPDGDKALMLVEEKILDGISLEAKPTRNVRDRSGVVRRVKAHLVGIALCRDPAYKTARVLAVRDEADDDETVVIEEDRSEFVPRDMDPELVARCRDLGVALPPRYAHLAETDTSSDEDTSDSDTGGD
jgi:HK97 family phage prohead protease